MTSPVKRSHVATCSRGEHVGKRYKWQILVTVVFGTFMAILDGTAVNVALPTLQHVFNTSVDQVDGVIIAYTLASGVTIPVTGFVAERFGSKRTYLTALALFVVGSACCALAPSLAWLVGFRVLQGVGGGMLAPLGIALLFDAFPEQERGLANGIFGLPLVVAPASGPLLGGYFTEYLNWRAIFLVNLPIGLLGIILGGFWLRSSHPSTPAKLDLPGLLLSTIGFTSLLYALERGASIGWTSPLLFLLLSVGVVAFVLLVFVEWQAPAPLLDLRLFLQRTYACASVVGWISYMALFGAEFLLPLYLQLLRGLTPLQIGWLLFPLAIASGIMSPIVGLLYNKIGGRWLLLLGSTSLAINAWELAHLSLQTSLLSILILVALRGAAIGLILQTTFTTALASLSPTQLPRASSLLSATVTLFQSGGVALLGTILAARTMLYQQQATHELHNPLTALGRQFLQHIQLLQQKGIPLGVAQIQAARQLLSTLASVHLNQGFHDAYLTTFWLAVGSILLSFALPGRFPFSSYKQKKASRAEPL